MKSVNSLFLIAVCTIFLFQACQTAGLTADDAQHETSFDQPAVYINSNRIELIRERIQNRSEPVYSAFRELMSQEEELLEHEAHVPDTWYVPPYYQDAEGHRLNKGFLMDDANASFKLALLYRLTDNGKYAEKSAYLIDAWSGLEELEKHDDSSLSFSYHFPSMIFAAGLLRGSEYWTENHENRFSDFVRERALPMNTMHRENNWGNWGLVLVLASSVYLDDSQLFEEGVERWKYFIEEQIAEDGHLPHEVTRNNGIGERGIWYTHFTLMPQTVAAEIAKVNGADLYDYQSPAGRTLEQAFRRVATWALNPKEFPYFKPDDEEEIQRGTDYISYFEILNERWPDDAAAEMLKQRRPVDAAHSAPLLTLTHGEPLEMDSHSEKPVGIIFDTDMTTDCDDAGALAMLHKYLIERDHPGPSDIAAIIGELMVDMP